jgi:hypothetical protein
MKFLKDWKFYYETMIKISKKLILMGQNHCIIQKHINFTLLKLTVQLKKCYFHLIIIVYNLLLKISYFL